MYKLFFKRMLDIVVSAALIIMFSPLIIVIAVVLMVANNGKIFFFQRRPGLNGHLFTMAKFRTMNDKRDATGALLPDRNRITLVGKLLRYTSLDELPQLFMVLGGKMSLVGPRPLLQEYLPLYSAHQLRRHEVKPGITGWAQVNGRNLLSWGEKFELDVHYADNINLILDFRILLLTLGKVIRLEGITSVGTVSMETFKGN